MHVQAFGGSFWPLNRSRENLHNFNKAIVQPTTSLPVGVWGAASVGERISTSSGASQTHATILVQTHHARHLQLPASVRGQPGTTILDPSESWLCTIATVRHESRYRSNCTSRVPLKGLGAKNVLTESFDRNDLTESFDRNVLIGFLFEIGF